MLENLIVPVLNRYDLLQRMLNSVDYPVGHLLIIDNGASRHPEDAPINTLQISDQFDEVTYLPMPANLGVAGSWNLGIKVFAHHRRWFIVSNDTYFHTGAVQKFAEADSEQFSYSATAPFWQAFLLPDKIVATVGLFDEQLYPAYFEDNDYDRRMRHHGFLERICITGVEHDNSSTLNSDEHFRTRNGQTFFANQTYFDSKKNREDYSAGSWDLQTVRRNDWLK